MANRIQLRRDTALNWNTANPILAQGEMGFETDTNQFKIGDGVSAWNSLTYFSGGGGGESTIRLNQLFPQSQYMIKSSNDSKKSGMRDYHPTERDYVQYMFEQAQKGEFAHICFTLNCSKNKIVTEKDNLYITIDRFKRGTQNKNKKQTVQRFRRQNDRRMQTNKVMYCWRDDYNDEGDGLDPTYYRYFYTTSDYSDDVNELFNDDPTVYIYTSHNGEQDSTGSNWATCLNALKSSGESVSNYYSGTVTRCPEFDVHDVAWIDGSRLLDYFTRMFGRKYSDGDGTYFFWANWRDDDSPVYAYMRDGNLVSNEVPKSVLDLTELTTVANFTGYTYLEDRRDLNWLAMSEDIDEDELLSDVNSWTFSKHIITNHNSRHVVCFDTYWWDYPINPVLLSRCEVLVPLRLPPDPDLGNIGYKAGTWVNLDELLNDEYGIQQWEMIQQPVFRLPYDTFYLWMRFSGWQKRAYYSGTFDDSGEYMQHQKNIIPAPGDGYLERYNRFGSSLKYKNHESRGSVTEYVQFNLATFDEIIHNKKTSSNAITKKLSLRGVKRRSTLL